MPRLLQNLSVTRWTSPAMPALGQLFSYSPGHGSHHCPWGTGWLHHSCGHHQHNPSCRHTCSARKRHFSFIDLPEHPHLLSKKGLRQQNLSLIYFTKSSSWSLKTWKCGVVSLAEHHPLSQHTSCLVTQAHWSLALLGCGSHLKMMVLLYFQVFREWHRLHEWQKEERSWFQSFLLSRYLGEHLHISPH